MNNRFEEVYNPIWDDFSITPISPWLYTIPASQYRRFLRVARVYGLEVVDSFCRDGLAWFYVTGDKKNDFRLSIRAKFDLPL